MKIILASKSPRRKELLESIGAKIEIMPSEAEEDIVENNPFELVKKLSEIKAVSVYDKIRDGIKNEDVCVLGADTIVFANGKILGKPKDRAEAYEMIKSISDNVHSVYTGFTIIFSDGRKITDYSETKVHVIDMSEQQINEYIDTNEPYDKAGGYGIQGLFGKYVERIEGDYDNVVGLPIGRIKEIISIG
ncbi:MAG: Maf family protein [Lachnospiraceae bacterium]|nr:Maf family protein [Lachnospiraceae bacterium]